jgi:hypothetical protein
VADKNDRGGWPDANNDDGAPPRRPVWPVVLVWAVVTFILAILVFGVAQDPAVRHLMH